MNAATFAYDISGVFHNNANSFIAGSTPFLAGILNSQASWWILCQICTDLQNGYLQAHNENLEQIIVPFATGIQQSTFGRLVETIIWLHGPEAAKMEEEERAKLIAFFERWLNGLVYELFFPDDLHAKKLNLFDATAKLNPSNLAKLPSTKKAQILQVMYGTVRDKSVIPGMLDDLRKIEPVRIIEGT
jgi:hypothetical protein